MKKLLLALCFFVSPLVAMKGEFKGEFKIIPSDHQEAAIEAYAKNWEGYQRAMVDYCDVPAGTYDGLFQTMAEEMAGTALKEQKEANSVMLESLGEQMREREEAEGEGVLLRVLNEGLLDGMRGQMEKSAALEHMIALTRGNLEATAKIFSMARKRYLEREGDR